MSQVVLGILDTASRADTVVDGLQRAGFNLSEVSVLFPDQSGTRDFAYEKGTKAPEGAVAGVGTGGVIGGTIGLLAGIGALAIPGLGPFIAAGPIMAALSGAAAGAAVGGVTGALIGFGIPEIQAKHYEGKLRSGAVLIAVHTETSEARKSAETILKNAGAHDVTATSEASVPRDQRAHA
ncbi:MAG TPA: DUF3341 domain-containing protein [Polyangiaceae bacterium]|nr:DUF3341 domain-containing protein [Polyangiaceae bacterium]